jgi:ubiquinone biosynthesis protein
MVVVEGVARSLDPEINIWTVARPVVEDYIKENVGPKAVARDLYDTARVLARFGPRLPALAERALLAQANPARSEHRSPWPERFAYGAVGLVLGLAVMAAIDLF